MESCIVFGTVEVVGGHLLKRRGWVLDQSSPSKISEISILSFPFLGFNGGGQAHPSSFYFYFFLMMVIRCRRAFSSSLLFTFSLPLSVRRQCLTHRLKQKVFLPPKQIANLTLDSAMHAWFMQSYILTQYYSL